MATAKSVIKLAKKTGANIVDIKFVDTFGAWQHFSMPIAELTEDLFSNGLGFDDSSIHGWKSIKTSDMIALPDPATAFIDPFSAVPMLSLSCTIAETGTLKPCTRDPRGIAQRAEKYLISTGIADQAFMGPEVEFFIFDNIQFDSKTNGTFYSIDGEEGIGNTGHEEKPNVGQKILSKEGCFPVPPADTQQNIRTEMILTMAELGIKLERRHHKVATAGHTAIDYRFNTLVTAADWMMIYKYVVKNVAKQHGKTACFMPQPLFGDNGSGMHTHQSLWSKGKPLFAGKEYAGLSQMALYYAGGLLKHAKALCAICNPTTNSYKRLVPGYEAPVILAYSARNRSAAVRIPTCGGNPKAKRLEYCPPDPAANPYLAFTALLMAGLDGIQNKIDPGKPLDKNPCELTPKEMRKIPNVAGSLSEALDCLQKDHAFLLQGDVFTKDFIDRWIHTKRKEYDAIRLRPHPYEFFMYYNV
jgi:glutamine synthetase